MLTLAPSGRKGEWLIAAADARYIQSFKEAFHPRRGVTLVCMSTPTPSATTRGVVASPSVNVAPVMTRLLNSRVMLTASTLFCITGEGEEDDALATAPFEDPLLGRLRKSTSETRISTKSLVKSAVNEPANGTTILDEAELSLQVRLSRSSSNYDVDDFDNDDVTTTTST